MENIAVDPSIEAATGVSVVPSIQTPPTPNNDVKPSTSGQGGSNGKTSVERYSVAKALGLADDPAKELNKLQKELRDGSKNQNPFAEVKNKENEQDTQTAPSREVKPEDDAKPKTPVAAKPVDALEEEDDSTKPAPKAEEAKPDSTIEALQKKIDELEKKLTPKEDSKESTQQKQVEETPEEIAKRQTEIDAKEREFIDKHLDVIDFNKYGGQLSEKDMEVILDGGKPAIEKFNEIRKRDMTNALLLARKTTAHDLNPIIQDFRNTLAPLLQQQEEIRSYETQMNIVKSNPDLATPQGREAIKDVTAVLKQQYADWYYSPQTSQADREKYIAQNALAIANKFAPKQPVQAEPKTPAQPVAQKKIPTPKAPAGNAPAGAAAGAGIDPKAMSGFAKSVMDI